MNRLVVGTGDRSELLLGYFTKYGDGGVDVLPIADLYKTEVRRLGEALGINRRIVAKRSSPRLWPGHIAESEIGMSYETIDRLFKLRFEEGLELPAIASKMKLDQANVNAILDKYQASQHKRQTPEICKLR
jgi:NAD+ synthase